VADTGRAGIATAETADGATAEGTSATTVEDSVANSPDKPPEEEPFKVDSQGTVVATATAGRALDLASPMPPDGVAITATHTATPHTVARRRTTHLRTTRRW